VHVYMHVRCALLADPGSSWASGAVGEELRGIHMNEIILNCVYNLC